jgi:hypothetical protein
VTFCFHIPLRVRSFVLPGPGEGSLQPADEVGRTVCEEYLLTRMRRCWPAGAPEPLRPMDRGFDGGLLLEWLLAGN